VDVKAFGFGGKNSGASGSGGGGGAEVAFSDVTFAKLYDSASPKLFQRLATGEHIKQVTFSFGAPGREGRRRPDVQAQRRHRDELRPGQNV
jgi:type VI protein secretion system component Hcp